jgi:site-specific DNA recombinase
MKAAVNLRVSSADQAGDGTSLGIQRERCTAYADSQGWELAEVYAEEGVSGDLERRPALDRLRHDARAGAFARLVVYDMDRLARNLRVQLNLAYELEDHGVEIIDMQHPNDPPFIRQIRGAVAEDELRKIRERTLRGVQAVVEAGWWPVGTPPYGTSALTLDLHGELEPLLVRAPMIGLLGLACQPQEQSEVDEPGKNGD